MKLHEVATRILGFTGVAVADVAQIPTAPGEILDSITAALAQIFQKAPGLLRGSTRGAVLAAPVTTTCTVAPDRMEASAVVDVVPNSLCTVRLQGSSVDHTATHVQKIGEGGLTACALGLSPAYAAATIPSPCTITGYHDALMLDGGVKPCGEVSIDNIPLREVADRDMAMALNGEDRTARYSTGKPLFWWDDIIQTKNESPALLASAGARRLLCFYPIPDQLYGVSYQYLCDTPNYAADADIFVEDSDKSFAFGLDDDVMRDILLPLAVEEYSAKPTFSNARLKDEIEKSAARARRRLADFTPKEGALRPWNT